MVAAPVLALALLVPKPALTAEPVPNREQLLSLITALEKPVEQARLVKQPLDAARHALDRARDARAAGDVAHGIELEALAFDYVTIAKDTLHAAELEAALKKTQTEFTKADTARRQTETLLEATVAQRERTKAELVRWRAEHDSKKTDGSVKAKPQKNGKGGKP